MAGLSSFIVSSVSLRGLQHRVAGAELLLLHREAGPVADALLHGLPLMPNDHHRRVVADLGGEIEHVVDDRPPRGLVQDLDRRRLHPRAEAGRENDHIEVFRHPSFLLIRSSVRP
jgi:hypothetical protein